MKIVLTQLSLAYILVAASNKLAGRGNLFIYGVNTPLTIAVFLCSSYGADLCRHFIMAGCFGQLSSWLAPIDQYFHPTATRRPCRGKHDRRFIPSSMELTA